ncbi:MogA/MoaB family molybdenum cofactor biosynthesis protein [Clostridium felsineum]|uniref:Molybdopterin adenylyltransferase n=1 Tax=Clostridium felsineum TaxID=36839 RepID=A0A1S8MAC5_9CLOT|nr:MogA/MoaB family molybdenum cofactor biosynthesis protein [Clostridium felsineum]MCR3760475.1 MogA/MoaB family molybdenum cofactor biosynthesis protein [Clostridium felsineum]URZ08804.1 Molybdopterin adenylyltransferase [Clostridium felsineum]URZ09432.1 Molybdopterin adenylyltransferase [Clostridium felsineum]URZ14212.1 Molybdopterin adenylyltransferase [Clostridium felsineum DSM 794]
MIKTAILTISDKGYSKEREDLTGPSIAKILPEDSYTVEYFKIIPDEKDIIIKELKHLCDDVKINLILTNGGTGFSKRDITPEATLEVVEKLTPGFNEVMRAESLKITPHAMLSRAVSGIRKSSIIINLPGSPKGAVENLQAILSAIPHGVKILTGEASECAKLRE